MTIRQGTNGRERDIIALFTQVFSAAEGKAEGDAIGQLVETMLHENNDDHLLIVTAEESGNLIASVIFSPMPYDADERQVYILSPMAVASERQRRGIGQAIISHGLSVLKEAGVDVAVTYGDPNYYSKTDFWPVDTLTVPAPFPLQHPHGWLAQSLKGGHLPPLKGVPRCVPALSDPAFW